MMCCIVSVDCTTLAIGSDRTGKLCVSYRGSIGDKTTLHAEAVMGRRFNDDKSANLVVGVLAPFDFCYGIIGIRILRFD
jgi:hypothetical protein